MGSAAAVSADAALPGLDSIIDLTRQVAELAEQGHWVRAAELNAERQSRLDVFCATLTPGDTPDETLDILGRILELNDTLIGSVQRRQQLLLQEASAMRTGRRAVAAYGS
jgi:hypothetical protein